MKYTWREEPAEGRRSAHIVYTDELGRDFMPWQMQSPRPWRAMTPDQVCAYNEWYDALPPGQRTSGMLQEARTVGSRAANALSYVRKADLAPDARYYTSEELKIIYDLQVVVALLERWKKTGKTPKWEG